MISIIRNMQSRKWINSSSCNVNAWFSVLPYSLKGMIIVLSIMQTISKLLSELIHLWHGACCQLHISSRFSIIAITSLLFLYTVLVIIFLLLIISMTGKKVWLHLWRKEPQNSKTAELYQKSCLCIFISCFNYV